MTIGHQESKKLDIVDILDIMSRTYRTHWTYQTHQTYRTYWTHPTHQTFCSLDTLDIFLIGHTVLKDKRSKETPDTRLYSRHTRSRWTNDTLDISDTFDIWPVEIKTH